jgi:PPOX class probable F420-dependent enzyme
MGFGTKVELAEEAPRPGLVELAAGSAHAGAAEPQAFAGAEPQAFAGLDSRRYCLLTSFRANGVAVHTPLWFAIDGGVVYMKTGVESGKVKRIRRYPRVEVAPCTMRGRPRGHAIAATARIVIDEAEEARAERALDRRYGLHRRLILGFLHLRGVRELYLALEPAALK